MKIKQTKKSKRPSRLVIITALLAVIVVVNALFTAYLLIRDRYDDDFKLGYLVVSAVETLNSPLPIEPVTGEAYIAEARLKLPPASSDLGPVLYRYDAASGTKFPAEVHLASKYNVSRTASAVIQAPSVYGNPTKTIEKVPELQACSRGVTITFVARDGEEATATKLLSNGKTVYFYTEKLCPNLNLLNYAKQLDTY